MPVHSPLTLEAVISGLAAASGLRDRVGTELEGYIEDKFRPRAFVRTDSGTSALRLALSTIRRRWPDRPVGLPAYACYDLATAAEGADVPVALYDLDPASLGPDPASLEAVVERGVSAVVLVHLYGVPVDLEEARAAIGGSEALIIEDAAQGAGGAYAGRALGSFGSLSVLSFGRGKGLTGGGGGALLAHDPAGGDLLEDARDDLAPARTGWPDALGTVGQWMLARPGLYRLPASVPGLNLGETVYHEPWLPALQSSFTAGVLDVTVRSEAQESELRRAVASRLQRSLEQSAHFEAVEPPEPATAGYLRLPALCEREASQWIVDSHATARGVMKGYPKPLIELEAVRRRCINGAHPYPGAEILARHLVTIPVHSRLSDTEVQELGRLITGGDVSTAASVTA